MNKRTVSESRADAAPAVWKKLHPSPMVYLCSCSKRWPAPTSLKSGPKVWTCSCGRTLAIRNGVIHAPATDVATWGSGGGYQP